MSAADLRADEARNPKGVYTRVRAGKIAESTSIRAPDEAPDASEHLMDAAALLGTVYFSISSTSSEILAIPIADDCSLRLTMEL